VSMVSTGASFTVLAPATSANLGSGFDTAGVALDWWDDLVVSQVDGSPGDIAVTVRGEESQTIAAGRDNLLVEAIMRFCEVMGRKLPAVELELSLGFPLGRGFGSSATGIALGLLAARELVAPELTNADLLELAIQVEGHPDNVTPCLLGGGTLCWNYDGHSRYQTLQIHPDLAAMALIAPKPMGTKTARQILPDTVPFKDAAWTAGRAALLPLALAGAFDLLLPATDDVLHQRRRLEAWPEAAALLSTLRSAGHAAFVSGAGPSLLVLSEHAQLARLKIDADQACRATTGWRLIELRLSGAGAHVSPPDLAAKP
jgi:homoserine kinase